MKNSRILLALARAYEGTQAGRTGTGERDLIRDYEDLLQAAGCRDGDARAEAEVHLAAASKAGVLRLVPHKRDSRLIESIRFSPADERAFYSFINARSPTEKRAGLAEQFTAAGTGENVPARWMESWQAWCAKLAVAAQCGGPIQPFDRSDLEGNAELLALLPRLLAWNGESLIRFASCVLCGDSKRLQQLAGKINSGLGQLTGGVTNSLDQLGIIENPRFVLLHGPLRLRLDRHWLDLAHLHGPCRISARDIERAEAIETPGTRCLTIENETTFHELAKLQSGALLIHTSFPGSATVALLQRLPSQIEIHHFGDTDPSGFHILLDLRQRVARSIRSLHMEYRPDPSSPVLDTAEVRQLKNLLGADLLAPERSHLQQMLAAGRKGCFEQESLGRPNTREWPFYWEQT